jgi:hypothetical protein
MAPNNTRTILVIGAAVVAGGLAEGTAFAQAPPAPAAAAPAAPAAPATPTFVPLYPGPGFPTCIVKAATDCRLPDGHPDLTGLYVAGGATGQAVFQNGLNSGTLGITFAGRGDNFVGFEADGGLFRETRDYGMPGPGSPSTTKPPQYRPEFWDAIIDAEYNGNFEDPAQRCFPNGVPRMGAPAAVVALPNQPFVMLIQSLREIRMVPTDGRKHDVTAVSAETWNGDPVGHWEGDTLVIENTNFTDRTAFRNSSEFLKVTERLTMIDANTIKYRFTVEDPHTWDQAWSGEYPIRRTNYPMYEYACHEGNYGLANTLRAARKAEADAKKAAASSTQQ